MSIFPKRTVPGKGVTIHWNFLGPAAGRKTLFPRAHIGVRDPQGKEHVLFDEHVLAFPSPPNPEKDARPPSSAFPGASLPLLVLAGHLEGRHKRERLVALLEGMQRGRHFYFHFPIPILAAPGRYVLVSELRVEGESLGSETAEEDFFFVEDLRAEETVPDGAGGFTAGVRNPGPEPVPALLLEYPEGGEAVHSALELPPAQSTSISLRSNKAYLLFSEGRELLSLGPDRSPFCLRNPEFLSLAKNSPAGPKFAVLHRESQQAYELEGEYAEVWSRAEGCRTRQEVRMPGTEAYDAMLGEGLILEIPSLPGWGSPS